MKDDLGLRRRHLAPIVLALLAAVVIVLMVLAWPNGSAGDAAQPTPCPDSIACRALKRYDAARAAETP